MEFKPFDKIDNIKKLHMVITQKIHGTNAAVIVFEKDGVLDLVCCSRTRFITPTDDNYGFAAFVHANKDAFLALGIGRHDGEWAGPGINSGEGLPEKAFVLFDYWRYEDRPMLPPQTTLVPVLYRGALDPSAITDTMSWLKLEGSALVPKFMRPEGIVVTIGGVRYKKVFDAEETGWKKSEKPKGEKKPDVDLSHLLQPIRLEKLLSKDERYRANYPDTTTQIVNDYIQDLRDEGQVDDYDAIRRPLTGQVYGFVRATMEQT